MDKWQNNTSKRKLVVRILNALRKWPSWHEIYRSTTNQVGQWLSLWISSTVFYRVPYPSNYSIFFFLHREALGTTFDICSFPFIMLPTQLSCWDYTTPVILGTSKNSYISLLFLFPYSSSYPFSNILIEPFFLILCQQMRRTDVSYDTYINPSMFIVAWRIAFSRTV